VAQIRILSWNVQVYGPAKYSHPANGDRLVEFIAAVANYAQANLLVVYETMSSVAAQVTYSLTQGLAAAAGGNWDSYTTEARVNGDRESYGFYWNTGSGFVPALDFTNKRVMGLSALEFPNNFSNTHGRRAAYATFRTTDTNRYFTATAYHAPPNARAIQGLQQLACMPQLYSAANVPAPANVDARLLCGDYNLDVNVQGEYAWLTNNVPVPPPPAVWGQGAGCVAATNGDSELGSYQDAVKVWGLPYANWSANPADYLRQLAIDNIFWASPAPGAVAGRVLDVLGQMMTPGTGIRQAAEQFALVLPAGGEAFPHAALIPPALNLSLAAAGCSFLLYRYAVSDHLPVLLWVSI
jgi:hypothetical protein